MPLRKDIKKILVIGSGPIIIGQAAEFDYAGTQMCRTLKDDGLEVVLVNSNPATIMTDKTMADKVYIEPLTIPVLKKIIKAEKPDSILPTMGGQTALTLSMQLAKEGFLDEQNVKLLGATPEIIDKAEDRQLFKDMLESIGEPVIPSKVVTNIVDALEFAEQIGYPVIVRPAYTLGGTGGGIVKNREELTIIGESGLRLSPITQVLIEKCVSGWKEIEFEIIRDSKNNTITVCSMENIDPVGACVGVKGSRVHGIVRELCNENIDVITWTDNVKLFIQRALSPARVSSININEEEHKAEVYLQPEEVSLAIGRGGMNIKLASMLTEYTIDVFRDIPESEDEEDIYLDEFSDEIDQWVIDAIKAIGLDTAKQVLNAPREMLIEKADLEEETVDHVLEVLHAEFEQQ